MGMKISSLLLSVVLVALIEGSLLLVVLASIDKENITSSKY